MVNLAGFQAPDPTSPDKGAEGVFECFAEEAVGMAITLRCPLYVERRVWEAAASSATATLEADKSGKGLGPSIRLEVKSPLPPPPPQEERREGGERNRDPGGEGRSRPSRNNQGGGGGGVPAAYEIKSPKALKAMGTAFKARVLLATEEFQMANKGRLPRPRVVETLGVNETLDPLLLPLMDEAVRRQVLTEEAAARGEVAEVEVLKREQSRRQGVLQQLAEVEAAFQVANRGELFDLEEHEADAAEAERAGGVAGLTGLGRARLALGGQIKNLRLELEVLTSLRADFSQDEGSYSSFLDKDDWYERDRRRSLGIDKKGRED
mmetsp:Transcript_68157/g.137107  ORF Transcript_68157/g.137107 Transcript_68157/m.137107 type:complete len:322 (-) Transcript_68157:100-1065(-)